MPTFRITSPDGKTYDVIGPEGSTAAQALERVKAGLVAQPAASKVRNADGSTDPTSYDPTEGMSGFEKFAAGYGSAVPRLLRGAGE